MYICIYIYIYTNNIVLLVALVAGLATALGLRAVLAGLGALVEGALMIIIIIIIVIVIILIIIIVIVIILILTTIVI